MVFATTHFQEELCVITNILHDMREKIYYFLGPRADCIIKLNTKKSIASLCGKM